MDSESLKIIESIFGEEGKLPIFDPKAYEAMPLSFWQNFKSELDYFYHKTNIPDLFYELKELVKAAGSFSEEEIVKLFMEPPAYAVTGMIGKERVYSRRNQLYFAESLILLRLSGAFLHKDPDVGYLKSESHFFLASAIEQKKYDEKFFRFIKRFFVVIDRYADQFTDLYDWMISILRDYLISKNYFRRLKSAERKVKKRFADYRRTLLRDKYQEYDSKISQEFFEKDPVLIEYPELMIDRINISVYSEEFMGYKDTVAGTVNVSPMEKDIETEQLMYAKRNLENEGYSDEEIESLFPIGLDKDFSFMENRSVLSGFKLKEKPKKIKDGNGSSLLWRTEGITYRFVYVHPSGFGPIRLDMYANMQRIIYNKIAMDCPEIIGAYNEELIEETNFIPLGFEK